jgi:hypothetical protein
VDSMDYEEDSPSETILIDGPVGQKPRILVPPVLWYTGRAGFGGRLFGPSYNVLAAVPLQLKYHTIAGE